MAHVTVITVVTVTVTVTVVGEKDCMTYLSTYRTVCCISAPPCCVSLCLSLLLRLQEGKRIRNNDEEGRSAIDYL